jgi:hypothetical protein
MSMNGIPGPLFRLLRIPIYFFRQMPELEPQEKSNSKVKGLQKDTFPCGLFPAKEAFPKQ